MMCDGYNRTNRTILFATSTLRKMHYTAPPPLHKVLFRQPAGQNAHTVEKPQEAIPVFAENAEEKCDEQPFFVTVCGLCLYKW